MKKFLFVSILMILPLLSRADESGTCGANLTWKFEEATMTLTISGSGDMYNYDVYRRSPWYNLSKYIVNVEIDKRVTTIGDRAFERCGSLSSITIPDGVTKIGKSSFTLCGLSSVSIPNSVTTIGEDAFSGCGNLNSISIPSSVTSIGKSAFQGCPLTSITFPNNLKSIGGSAFRGCNKLTSISIPSSVTSIGAAAFSQCSSLISISVEEGNEFYDSRDNCNAIIETQKNELIAGCTNTVIPNNVAVIGESVFEGNNKLTSISIPNSVSVIGRGAFASCNNLTNIFIPNSVTIIEQGAFSGCGLTSVTIPNSVTSIGEYNQEIKGETNVEIIPVIA